MPLGCVVRRVDGPLEIGITLLNHVQHGLHTYTTHEEQEDKTELVGENFSTHAPENRGQLAGIEVAVTPAMTVPNFVYSRIEQWLRYFFVTPCMRKTWRPSSGCHRKASIR